MRLEVVVLELVLALALAPLALNSLTVIATFFLQAAAAAAAIFKTQFC